METVIPIVYDVAALVFVVSMVASGMHRGFARAAVSLAGYVAALIGAAACSAPLAKGIYRAFIGPRLTKGIAEKLTAAQPDALGESLSELVRGFPQVLYDALGLDRAQMIEAVTGLVEHGGADAAKSISDALIAPLVITLLRAVLFLLIFGAAMFFVKKLAWVFGGINHLPVIGPLNRVFGGVVGLLEAALTLYVLLLVVNVLLLIAGGEIAAKIGGEPVPLLGQAVLERTVLWQALAKWNPLEALLNLGSLQSQELGRQLAQSAGKAFV